MNILKVTTSFCTVTGALIVALGMGRMSQAVEFRTLDGSDNNQTDTSRGQADTTMPRLLAPSYDDGINAPRSTAVSGSPLPNPRDVSNTVAAQGPREMDNWMGASSWLWQWGQFLDHDIALVDEGPFPEFQPIAVSPTNIATGQPDPLAPMIPFSRTGAAPGTGSGVVPREQVNTLSAYIDASGVYGTDSTRADFLRTQDGTGQLKTSTGVGGEVLLPMNREIDPFPNANPPTAPGVDPPPAETLFLAGDVRANEQLALIANHTLFVREHNYLTQSLTARYSTDQLQQMASDAGLTDSGGDPDVGEYLYQAARRIVGAEVQAITYQEFLPMMIGPDALSPYTGYDETVDAGILNEFATAAYRVGHTMLAPQLLMVGSDYTMHDSVALRDAFFNPDFVVQNGVDSILMGLCFGSTQEVDTMVVDDVRSFLFAADIGGLDLAAVNINRGRDHGLRAYNDAREDLGLGRYDTFDQITSDPDIAMRLADVYESVDDIDLWVGALAEDPYNDGLVGQTLHVILAEQFTRLRDGDRFFYLNDPMLQEIYPEVQEIRLSDILARNTAMDAMPENVFARLQTVPEPASTGLPMLLGTLFFLVMNRRRLWARSR